MTGTLLHIHLATDHAGPMRAVQEALAVVGQGLEGDRYFGTTRQVTLVATGELEKAAAELGRAIEAGTTRRNLTIDVDSLPRIHGSRIRIGEVVLSVWRDCAPCEVMDEEVGAGAREALRGRAGVSARVVTGGVLRVGDRARVETAPAVAGSLHQINISSGGVPKLPVPAAVVTINGIEGDGHHDLEHHGGPLRALCLFSLEAIERLATEGHPIGAGSAGENLTVSGLDWNEVVPGARLRIGPEVEIEVTNYTTPCRKNAHWFLGGDFMQIHQARRPGMSRVYARVIREGRIEAGQAVVFA